jgi:hypothetical protein
VGTDGCSGCGMTGAVGSEACWEMKRREKMVRCGVVVDVQSGFPAWGVMIESGGNKVAR